MVNIRKCVNVIHYKVKVEKQFSYFNIYRKEIWKKFTTPLLKTKQNDGNNKKLSWQSTIRMQFIQSDK